MQYVLAVTDHGATDWQTTTRSEVQIVSVDFDLLESKADLFLDEIKDLARQVKALPDSIRWKNDVFERLQILHDRRKEQEVFC